ncbi:MAG TPA: 3-phosphoshikimate 1-carboxyvinyltransferase, partial [Acidimicrobiales bacterium]|nr:3-phosphoshikimate 1-carboxyvinyltransferase [Acidimicrobiales bacterium]
MTGNGARAVEPVAGPLDATVVVPGSKSVTNRALVCAGLAAGVSTLTGALVADDTEAMVDCLRRLGIAVAAVDGGTTLVVEGCGGSIPATRARLDVTVTGDHLPLTIETHGLRGGTVAVAADVSSQFASGLLLAGPATSAGLHLELTTAPVSRPYLDLTVDVMRSFGAEVAVDGAVFAVAPGGYEAAVHAVEADASAAAYFFAAAAICGGRVTVPGLGRLSHQGDVGFVHLLERMGATVEQTDGATTVIGAHPLHGIEANLSGLSDTAATLAVTAAFASTPTRVTGVGFARAKESDRVGGVVAELQRLGIDAVEEPDGFVVRPGPFRPGRVETYDDHRMAMSFALVGLRVPG